jgi:hypothetical protein
MGESSIISDVYNASIPATIVNRRSFICVVPICFLALEESGVTLSIKD